MPTILDFGRIVLKFISYFLKDIQFCHSNIEKFQDGALGCHHEAESKISCYPDTGRR
jgi:hypothetical protein